MLPDYISLSEAIELLPKVDGKPVSDRTVRKWINQGVMVRGSRVYLKADHIGVRVFTTVEWIEQFIEECTPKRPEPKPMSQRSRRAAAMRVLCAEGLLKYK